MWNSLLTTFAVASSIVATTQATPSKDDAARVIGGTDAAVGEYPYFVQGPGCAGAMISSDVVLFAAHCGNLFLNHQLNVGGYRLNSADEGAQPRFCDVWIPDEKYATGCAPGKRTFINWDFALCKLDKPVDLDNNGNNNNNPRSIGVALNFEESVPQVGNDLRVMGFGDTDPNFPFVEPEIIQEVAVPYVTNAVCNEPNRYDGEITDQMLCAGVTDVGGKDACQGDSGGPIVLRTTDSSNQVVDEIVGVVSWGIGCAQAQYPGVYSRVSQNTDWIVEKSCDDLQTDADFCPARRRRQLQDEVCDNELVVTVKTDDRADQTSWKLLDASGTVVKKRKFMVNNFEYEHAPICLPAGCYEFELKDQQNNGISNGGFYKGELNGAEIFFGAGDSFGQFGRASFCTDGSSAPPTEPPLECVDELPRCSKLEKGNTRRKCRRKRNGEKLFNICKATCAKVGLGPCA